MFGKRKRERERESAKAASLMSSRDPLVRHLASQKTLAEASTVRQSFKPYQQVVEVLREDPGASQRRLLPVQRVQWCRQTCTFISSSAVDGLCRDRP